MLKHLTWLSLTLCSLLAILPASAAESSSRKAIGSEYDKSAKAASMKYLDGALAIRAPGFKGYGLDGKPIDSALQERQMQRVFRTALSIKENILLISLKDTDATHATCEVRDSLEVTQLAGANKSPVIVHVDTISTDEWIKTGKGWKQASSRVRKQTSERRESNPGESKTGASPTPAAK